MQLWSAKMFLINAFSGHEQVDTPRTLSPVTHLFLFPTSEVENWMIA